MLKSLKGSLEGARQGVRSTLQEARNGVHAASERVSERVSHPNGFLRSSSRALSGAVSGALGVRDRTRKFGGSIVIRNELPVEARLSFSRSALPRSRLHKYVMQPGSEYTFDPGESGDFDFILDVNLARASSTVVREAIYRVVADSESADSSAVVAVVQVVETAPRRRTDLLSSTPGLSFSFSASGWLFIYQLGAAECLQNHGIAKNPHVRVAGASGGALTAALMMYGCDMCAIKDLIKRCGKEVYGDWTKAADLRRFLFEAMKTVIRDGSFRHPAFVSGRVEVAVSEAGFEASQSLGSRLGEAIRVVRGASMVKGRRISQVASSSEAAIALLASSSMGISGMPFKYVNEEGREVIVADGAVTDFMPEIDAFSVKIKPFSDALNIMGQSMPDVAPSEFVPGNYAVWPPKAAIVDHLYELGYQDMDAWLEQHLQERLAQVQEQLAQERLTGALPGDLPFVEFDCADDGMTWVEEVLRQVPIGMRDQLGIKGQKSATEAHGRGAGAAEESSVETVAAQLVAMGFSEHASRRAALSVGDAGIQAAAEEIIEHGEDLDISDR